MRVNMRRGWLVCGIEVRWALRGVQERRDAQLPTGRWSAKHPHPVTTRIRPCFRRRWRVPRDPLPPLRPSPCARRSSWCLLLRWRRCLPVTSSSRRGTCCRPRRSRGGLRHRPGHQSLFNIRHGRDLRFSRRRGRAGRQHRMGGGRCVEVAD